MSGIPERARAAVRQVTCLLPPRRRAEVQAELLGHLWHGHLDAQLGGLAEAEAWDSALSEIGPRWRLAAGLAVSHWYLTLRRVLLVGLVLGGTTYALQTHAVTAPVPSVEARP